MIFIAKADGTLSRVIPSAVNQGSIGVNELVLIAPYPKGSAVTAAFILPNGIRTTPTLSSATEIPDVIEGNTYNAWVFELTAAITEYAGNVTVQFYVTSANGVLATYADTFAVAKGVMPEMPDDPTDDVYNNILAAYGEASARLTTAESDISSIKADIGADYTSGTIKGRIYAAETSIQSNTSEIIQTKSRVSTNERDISAIEEAIGNDDTEGTVKGRIKTAEGDIDDLEGRTGNLEDKASEFESDFVIVDGRLVALERNASTAATDISALQTSLKNFGIFNRAEYNKTTNTIILWFVKNGENQKVEIPLEDFLNADELEDEIAAKISALTQEYQASIEQSEANARASETAAKAAQTAAESAARKAEQHESFASQAAVAANTFSASAREEKEEAENARTEAQKASADARESARKAEMYSITNEDRWAVIDKRLTNVENGISADPFVTDDSVAYQKTAPASALPFAALERLGGMSIVIDGTLRHAAVTEAEIEGRNVFSPTEISFTGIKSVTLPEILPAGRYFLSAEWESESSDDSIGFNPMYTDNTYYGLIKIARSYSKRSFTASKPFQKFALYSHGDGAGQSTGISCEITKIQLYRSPSSATDGLPFEEPYLEHFPIATSLQNLPYYGYGINADVNNHIDYEKTEYVQMCSERAYQSGDENNPEVVTDGTSTVYALSTPVRTPITFTDNYIRVGGSGTLTFVNEHKLAVPSTVLYLTKEASV